MKVCTLAVRPTFVWTNHLTNWNGHQSPFCWRAAENLSRPHWFWEVLMDKLHLGHIKFVIPCKHVMCVYTWFWLEPSMTPHMALIWSGVCCLDSATCWKRHNHRLAKSLGFTFTNSRLGGFGSPVIVVCDHCWALPLLFAVPKWPLLYSVVPEL